MENKKIFINTFPYDDDNKQKVWTVGIFEMEYGEDKEVHFLHNIGKQKIKDDALNAGIEYSIKYLLKKL